MLHPSNNQGNNTHYRLSVQVSLIGLSFLVTDNTNKEPVFYSENSMETDFTPEDLLGELEKIIFRNEILQSQFSTVTIIYSTPIFSVVPLELFDPTKASEYLKFNAKILGDDFVAHDVLESHNMVLVYVPLMNINNYFFDKYGTFDFYHAATILLNTILKTEKDSLAPKVYLHLQKNNFNCVIVRNGKLLLCNNYPYATPEDFIYYVLFCFEQLKLNPETVQTFFCGEVEKGDSIYTIAYTYIRNINFAEPSSNSNESKSEATGNFILNHVF